MKENSVCYMVTVWIVGLWLIALGLSVFVHNSPWQEISRTFVEVLIYLIVFILLFSFSPICQYFTKIPGPHKLILITFFILLFIGQFVDQTRLTFPFTSWAMYGKPEHPDTLVFYRCLRIDENQNKITINTEALFPFIDKSEVASKLKELSKKAFLNDDVAVQKEYRRKLTEWLLAIGQIYNHQHSGQPIRSVELQKCYLKLSDGGKPEILREPLWRVDLGSQTLQ
jgi:hypothetical protein